jgi:cytidine deaminase
MSTLIQPTETKWTELLSEAWKARENAYLIGKTKVGAAALSSSGKIFTGCNVEHRFRSHDIHAEVNAIGTMVSAGENSLVAIVIVAERERFTPCGSCMDWIFQFGGPDCFVAFQSSPEKRLDIYTAHDLMPHYPI